MLHSECKGIQSYGHSLKFWDKVTELANSLEFCSIDKVKAELIGSNDELSKWAKQLPDNFFKSIGTEEMKPYIEQIAPWAANSNYKQSAKDRFLQAEYADPFLVAYAMSHENVIVVTSGDFKENNLYCLSGLGVKLLAYGLHISVKKEDYHGTALPIATRDDVRDILKNENIVTYDVVKNLSDDK